MVDAFHTHFYMVMDRFLATIYQQAVSCGAQRILFLAREGVWIEHAFARWLDRNQSSVPLSSSIVYTSRLASFAPSFTHFSDELLQTLAVNYPRMSAYTLGMTVGLAREQAQELARVTANREFNLSRRLDREALLHDSRVASVITRLIRERRPAFAAYLKSLCAGLAPGASVLLVDVGWRGSIQDNLTRALPNFSIHGVYLGLRDEHSLANAARKHAAVVQWSHEVEDQACLSHPTALEMLFNCPCPTTISYRMGGDGRAVPVWGAPPRWGPACQRFTDRLQQGYEAHLAASPQAPPDVPSALADKGAQACWALLAQPSPAAARAFMNLVHDEQFGTGERIWRAQSVLSLRNMLSLVRGAQYRARFKLRLLQQKWPQALMVHPLLTPMRNRFNRAVLETLASKRRS